MRAFELNDMPLDFFSPSCIKVNAQELQEPAGSVIDEYDYREAFNIYERIYDSLEPLTGKKGAADINDLIYKFTNVIILKRQNYQSVTGTSFRLLMDTILGVLYWEMSKW